MLFAIIAAMKKKTRLEDLVNWMDRALDVAAFADDVSNNGIQLERRAGGAGAITRVAFAVDASLRAVRAAADAGAQLLVVHHGISWGGGIRRLAGGVYEVVRAAMDADLAIYACHLPLDAHPTLGNNAQLAKALKLKKLRPAFAWHGHVLGLVGETASETVGLCSGGAGDFAEEAKRLGCDVFVTGEADWGEVIAAENCGIELRLLGHYQTETGGVRALAAAMKKKFPVETIDLTTTLMPKRK